MLTEPLLEELRAGRHDPLIATRRPGGRALLSVPLADEEYVLVAAPRWTPRTGSAPAPDDLCARLKDVPLVTCAEDLPIVRRYWRLVFGKQLTPMPTPTSCASSTPSAGPRSAGRSPIPNAVPEPKRWTDRVVAALIGPYAPVAIILTASFASCRRGPGGVRAEAGPSL
ncbi:type 2 periplasmic-binding domain-containing protein [Streptomyces cyaneochromogenes]|uniref:hypothetical protein n=1 Tax=Streptomyces cyaneochromogenes TaxID=2496836 RepID=UPI00267E7478